MAPRGARSPRVAQRCAALAAGLLVGALGIGGALHLSFAAPDVGDGIALRLVDPILPRTPPASLARVHLVEPLPAPPAPVQTALALPEPPPVHLSASRAAMPKPDLATVARQCRPVEAVGAPLAPAVDPALRLVAAARAQLDRISIYDARYVPIAYPGGDVSPLTGVCTDVIVRAYRALGIDLQVAVRTAGVGRGDPSIDHRRTETLRTFFTRMGAARGISAHGEDFAPGDLVTYHRPQNRLSTSHIAIVSDRLGASGHPMIIHDRGHGVQEEDALFVDRITGVYRYLPAASDPLVASVPASVAASSTPRGSNARWPQPPMRSSRPIETMAAAPGRALR